jgi:hypothetical protein
MTMTTLMMPEDVAHLCATHLRGTDAVGNVNYRAAKDHAASLSK